MQLGQARLSRGLRPSMSARTKFLDLRSGGGVCDELEKGNVISGKGAWGGNKEETWRRDMADVWRLRPGLRRTMIAVDDEEEEV